MTSATTSARLCVRGVFCVVVAIGTLTSARAWAAASLALTPATWNIIGLDSNNPSTGPNRFPVGARVCNSGDTAATGLTASFLWDATDPNIALRAGSNATLSIATLDPGACADVDFEVEVTRSATSYGRTARYYIELAWSGGPTLTTPRPRELFVERLVSQARNAVSDVQVGDSLGTLSSVPNGGAMSFLVGNSYYIRVVGSTATQGYEQVESFITLPNTVFQVLSVSTTYSANTSANVSNPSPFAYGDACSWDNNPNSPSYRSCRGSGKVGGSVVATYHVKILSGASAQGLSTLLYDFSGSSFHYNSDYDVATRTAYVVSPADVTFSQSFTPTTIVSGGTSTLALRITNPTSSTLTGVNFTSALPVSPGAMVIAAAPSPSTSGCGSPTFAPSAGASSIALSSGSIAPGATCTVKVNVTATAVGTYTSTTDHLFLDGTSDTGKTASASLSVATSGGTCTSGTMASWTVPVGTTANPPDLSGGLPTVRAGNVTTATLAAALPGSTQIVTSGGQGDTTAWSTYGYKNAGQYVQMVLDTKSYSNVQMSFWVANPGSANGPTSYVVAYNSGSGFNTARTVTSPPAAYTQQVIDLTGLTSTTGNTTFRITATGALNDSSGAGLNFDNITFTGCSSVPAPTLSKAFDSSSIKLGVESSVLTFSVGNAASGATALTGVAFTDTMPSGLVVASPSGATTNCPSGSLAATPGSNVIALSGASLAAGATCTASVSVTATAAGIYDNVSGNISANESPANIGASGYGSASITVIAPPTIDFDFVETPIFTGASTTASFALRNPNVSASLSGVAFSSTLPAGLTVADDVVSVCGGTLMTTAPSFIVLSGATLSALETCAFDVTLVGASAGLQDTTVGPVSATNGGTGNSVTATLLVRDPTTAIAFLKQIAPSSSGPWSSFRATSEGADVYYRFTVENVGDVPLTAIAVSDDMVTMTCPAWPDLPVASASNDDHIASCVVGPLTAVLGSNVNTATAEGTHGGTTVSATSSATYATTGLTLTSAAVESSFKTGDLLHFDYVVTNTGFAALVGPVVVDEIITSATCPSLTTTGDGDDVLDAGESLTCTSTYSASAADFSTGFITSNASSTVDGVESNMASVTVNADTSCAQPTDPTHGTYASCDGTASGGTCSLVCNSGYVASGDATCTNGAWSAQTCDPSPCAQPASPANGTYAACDGTASGGSCALTCSTGYTPSGDATCSLGMWSAETCNPDACSQPADPTNGTFASCDGTASGGSCTLTCSSGYTASGNATCTLGSWSVETCNADSCAQPVDPANGSYASCSGTASGGSCTLTCSSGYTASGNATCTLGAWSTETCSPSPCAQPADPANGTYTACGGTASGGSCALTCASGYAASGDASCVLGAWSIETCRATCASDGECSAPASSCDTRRSVCVECLTNDQCASGVCNTVANTCTRGCSTDADCGGSTPKCNTVDNLCVACLTSAQCTSGVCDTAGHVCVGCAADSDCSGGLVCDRGSKSCVASGCNAVNSCGGATPFCDPVKDHCVGCLVDDDCGPATFCDSATGSCLECTQDSECAAPNPFCDVATKRCVACLGDADCSTGVCHPTAETCLACVDDADCSGGRCDHAALTCVPLNFCGDGAVDVGEGCDDGNSVAGDGCTTSCRVEPGYACGVTPGLSGTASCATGQCYLAAGPTGVCGDSDTDGDGIPDIVDIDDDNDGILDATEGDRAVDTDGDGIADSVDLDSDGDGLTDAIEAGHHLGDHDIDGHVDCASGVGRNGFCDDLEVGADSGLADYDGDGVADGSPIDTDADGVADFRDRDSDNDGWSDAVEAGHHLGDSDDDGVMDCFSGVGVNGLCDDLETAPDSGSTDFDGDGLKDGEPLDTDGDGLPDYRDLDSDNDGLSDADELRYGTDPRNPDSDGGGASDGEEVAQGRNPLASDDDALSVSGGSLFGCRAVSNVDSAGAVLGVWLLVRRLTKKRENDSV